MRLTKRYTLYYEKYKRMITKFAWKYYLSSSIPFDELLSEGNLIFCQAVQTHKSNRGSFSTWLYILLQQRLGQFVYQQTLNKSMLVDNSVSVLDYVSIQPEQRNKLLYAELKKELSWKAKKIVEFLESPPINFDLSLPPKKIRGNIFRHYREKGWTYTCLWKSFQEIKNAVDNYNL